MRICSLLPSATEIVYALGLGDQLVAVTHECDEPPAVAALPRITRSAIDPATLTSAQIDALVTEHLHDHRGIYHLDRPLLDRLNPDLILTQELCDVCAVSYNEVQAAARTLYGERQILSLEPVSLAGIFDTLRVVGQATGHTAQAEGLIDQLQARIERVQQATAAVAHRPVVACIEWIDPPFVGGHWVPEMVAVAGGTDPLGRAGEPSFRLTWDEVIAARPEVVVLMPCGFDVARTRAEYEAAAATRPAAWADVPAVRAGQVWAVHANAFFSRPGPRVVDGIEILAAILHPDRFPAPAPDHALRLI